MIKNIAKHPHRKPDNRYSPLDLVVCEGETERDYLRELARKWRIHVQICKGDGTDPKSIVNTAKRKTKNDGVKYDQIFCIFDRDHDHLAFVEAIRLCKSLKFNPIVSNPCFELWFFLHIQTRQTAFGDPQQMLKALKKLPGFEKYDKDGGYAFDLTFCQIDKACKHATLLSENQSHDFQNDPFTNMHFIISRFRILKETQSYFGKNN